MDGFLDYLWTVFWPFWTDFGPILDYLLTVFWPFWTVFGPLWTAFGTYLDRFWDHLWTVFCTVFLDHFSTVFWIIFNPFFVSLLASFGILGFFGPFSQYFRQKFILKWLPWNVDNISFVRIYLFILKF